MKNISPVLFKPSSTLLIDDDTFFIENVASLLPKDAYAQTASQEKIENLCRSEIFYTSGKSVDASNLISPETINVLFDSPKDRVVSTIVIDQYMTPKNGLDILADFKSPFIQKILISNMLTNEEAIQALNEGLINFYLCKMEPNFIKNLSTAIYESQHRFFCHLSMALPNFLSKSNPLTEIETHKLIKQIKEDFNTPYYYASNNLRKFSFTNEISSKKLIFNIIPKLELNEYLNSHQAEVVPQEILNLIKNEKMLPCFEDAFIPDGEIWGEYLQPAKSFQGQQKYLYSIYQEPNNEPV